jgi:Rieske oxygenase family protein
MRIFAIGNESRAQGKNNVHNDYGIDRVAQKYFTFTGIKTFPLQDIAMMENQWGSLADRTLEHPTSLDHRIIYVRRRLLKGVQASRNSGGRANTCPLQGRHRAATASPLGCAIHK